MTDLLYQTDSYLREFNATVVAVDAAAGRVALDRTAFYPGGGGQPGDVVHRQAHQRATRGGLGDQPFHRGDEIRLAVLRR